MGVTLISPTNGSFDTCRMHNWKVQNVRIEVQRYGLTYKDTKVWMRYECTDSGTKVRIEVQK